MTYSMKEGIDKVLANRGAYAFIMESVSIDYVVSEQHQTDIMSTDLCFRLLGTAI